MCKTFEKNKKDLNIESSISRSIVDVGSVVDRHRVISEAYSTCAILVTVHITPFNP